MSFPFVSRFLLALCCLLLTPAAAALDEIEPGALPELAADEGLLVVAVDSRQPLYGLRFGRDGRMLGSAFIRRLPQGRSHRLFKAKAGDYQWMEVQPFGGWRFGLRDDGEFRFNVEAGSVSYPGDLSFEASSLWRAQLRMANRGVAAIDWLRQSHPQLLERHGFRFLGDSPDPFPAAYLAAVGASTTASVPTAAAETALTAPPEPGSLSLTPETLWQQSPLTDLALSPDGRFLAVELSSPLPEEETAGAIDTDKAKDADAEPPRQWRIELIDLQKGDRHLIAQSPFMYASLSWSGPDRLVLEVGPDGQRIIEVVRVQRGESGDARFERVRVPRRGELISALPAEPDHILLGSYTRRGQLMVHRVDVSSPEAAQAFHGNQANRLNKGVEGDLTWMVDGRGRLRMALVENDEKRVLLHGVDGVYETQIELDDALGFNPFALSFDGDTLYGTSDRDRGQLDLVEFDIATQSITRTLFSREGVDVTSVLRDARGDVIGVGYYREGRPMSEYFGEQERRDEAALQRALPGRSASTAARSEDGLQRLLWVDGPDTPPALFHFDGERRSLSPVMEVSPWLAGLSFASTRAIATQARDGTRIEAFLTLPQGDGPHPLVLFPHGGPIGVADSLHFDSELQFLAGLGYAVLQVNFRGSEGYGRAFREAGKRNFGRLIEDDIDAALEAVLATEPLDRERMCVLGSSYGGFSALVASLRWPGRFRCAVSINGPTDLPLLFTASDASASEERRTRLVDIVGDPNEMLDELRTTSPAYRADELQTPLMLIQGARDARVDPEHARRLLRMLELRGVRATGLWLEDEGHSIRSLKNRHRMWRGIAGFLQTHLDEKP
jgi:dipeptidyl aminopeptidase/acylaminoacyl peptidase